MHARGLGTAATALSAVLLAFEAASYLSLPVCAQQPASDSGASQGAALPADIQAKLDNMQEALKAARAAGDARAEARVLNQVSRVYLDTSDYKKAQDGYKEALTLARAAKDPLEEAAALNGIGNCDLSMSEYDAAMVAYRQALAVAAASGDLQGQAVALGGLGWASANVGHNQEALEFYRRALPLAQKASDRDAEARVLRRTGWVYYLLGDLPRALEYDKQALPLFRKIHNPYGEATVLNDLGLIYSAMGQNHKALAYYTESSPMFRRAGDRESEALTWNMMGISYGHLGNRQAELEYYKKALPVIQQVGDVVNQAWTLNAIGRVYSILGEKQRAQDHYNRALPLANAANDPIVKASILDNMMLNQSSLHPALAIFYGKQAVNCVQQVRSNMQGLGAELQKTFLASKGDYFHHLADLLIDQGRLPEAQQVLDLLKQQEYRDYVRGDAANTLSPLSLTPAEEQAEADYQKSTEQLVALGQQWADLKKMSSRTAEQEHQFQQLSAQLEMASKGLNDYYARLYALFGHNSEANRQVADVKGEVSVLKQTIAKMPRTVALYTLVGSDRYRVIVITGSATVAREYPITERDLNQKIAAFGRALRDPDFDAKPLAKDLYKVLIGPVNADLDQAQAQTLVWSLDGALRYLPIAALYDGTHYVVENYNTVTITPASIPHLSDQPNVSSLSAVAMGISRQYEEELPPLPAVAGELEAVVKDVQVQGANGVLPGTLLLNGAFTEKALEDQLGHSHTVVHIASHFVFQPGDDSHSFLLLAGKDADGGGFRLTVADFRDNQNLTLDDTDLLTLSACKTGMSGSAGNGREVDGLGTTAQLKGAKAVISSLWEVNDASTGLLMADFYKRWANGAGKVAKIEALRRAQLDLLHGNVTPPSGTNDRGSAVHDKPGQDASPVGYSHPYYWAPFVLMGNWR